MCVGSTPVILVGFVRPNELAGLLFGSDKCSNDLRSRTSFIARSSAVVPEILEIAEPITWKAVAIQYILHSQQMEMTNRPAGANRVTTSVVTEIKMSNPHSTPLPAAISSAADCISQVNTYTGQADMCLISRMRGKVLLGTLFK